MNGVSKKLHIVSVSITALIGIAAKAENPLPYALIIGVICVAHMAVQAFIDWKNDK